MGGSQCSARDAEMHALGHIAAQPSLQSVSIRSCHLDPGEPCSTIRMGDLAASRVQVRVIPGHERTSPWLDPGQVHTDRPPANRFTGRQNTGPSLGGQTGTSRRDLDVLGLDRPSSQTRTACGHRRHDRPTLGRRGCLTPVDDSKKLQVLIPERHDDVGRASARMLPAFQDNETECLHAVPSGDEVVDEDDRLYQSVAHGPILMV